MIFTERIARKKHKCSICNGNIYKGNRYTNITGKVPRLDKNDNQIGIKYINDHTHLNYSCVGRLTTISINQAKQLIIKCDKGHHEYEEDTIFDHYAGCHKVDSPTGVFYCKNCGKEKNNK